MTESRQDAVRAAGSPMVPRERPSWARADDAARQVTPPARAGDEGLTEQAARQAREAGGQLLDDGRARARAEVDQRSTWAGERVAGIASDIRDVAGDLRSRGRDQPARVAEDAAERVARFGEYLRTADGDRILADVRDVSRRQPALIVAGAAVIGIAAGRLLKASEHDEQRRIGHG